LISPEISINLQFRAAEFRARDRQSIQFTLTNNSNETVNVLKWNTPLEGINNDIFRIEKDGKPTVYLGRMVKRGAPRPEDYITMEPRGSVSVEVDLTEYYDISEPGQYDVRYRLAILDLGRESPQTLARRFLEEPSLPIHHIQSNVTRFVLLEPREPKQINGISVEWLAEHRDINAKRPPSFTSCSTTQQIDLDNALREAEEIANESRLALSNTYKGDRLGAIRYREWFGNYDNERYDKVTDNFKKIFDALANKTITFMCDCTGYFYAYVHRTRPYEIHLCNKFWEASLTGTDSKAGTIVHETSHFNIVAGTDDNAYGQMECRQLAIVSPTEAIANADSYEYFAENNPHLTMPVNKADLTIYVPLPVSYPQIKLVEKPDLGVIPPPPPPPENTTEILVSKPSNGTLSISQDSAALAYTPNPGFYGKDTFTFTVNGTEVASVTIVLNEPSSVSATQSQ
jgi:peptidyl-Lys metalloendopeptidase